jgi:hypothetical protein
METSKAERLIDEVLESQARATAAEENHHPMVSQLNADRDDARNEALEYIEVLEAVIREIGDEIVGAANWARPVERPGGIFAWYCRYCDRQAQEWVNIKHRPNCPTVIAIELLLR